MRCGATRPVLSIGKLAAGQARYYERQVAHGRDDYYSGRGEAPGDGRVAARRRSGSPARSEAASTR